MARGGRSFGLALLLAAAGGLGPAPAAKPAERPPRLVDWLDGPVRYVATVDEIKLFESLDTDEQRIAFVDGFWDRRDPLPATPQNEYRQLFWDRVKEANERFSTAKPGWKTDRGKIYILYGPPTRVEDDPHADTGGLVTAGRGLIRWFYEGRAGGRLDIDPVLVVPFVRDLTGDYRLSYDPKLSSLAFNVLDLKDKDQLEVERWLDIVAPPIRSELSVMMDLGKLQEAPHPEQILIERVETREAYGTYPIPVEAARYRHPTGRTLLVVTVGIPGREGDATKPVLVARLSPRDATIPKRYLSEESFRTEGTGPGRLAQARILLEPGVWDLTVLAADPAVKRGASGLYQGTIEIPGPVEQLRLSDVILARALEPLPYASLFTYEEPFLVGAFRVVPRLGQTLARGATVTLFYDVYGGSPPFRISYRVEGRENDGRWTALGEPSVQEGAEGAQQGWSLPTGPRWPVGEYRIAITVEDSKGASVTVFRPFTLES